MSWWTVLWIKDSLCERFTSSLLDSFLAAPALYIRYALRTLLCVYRQSKSIRLPIWFHKKKGITRRERGTIIEEDIGLSTTGGRKGIEREPISVCQWIDREQTRVTSRRSNLQLHYSKDNRELYILQINNREKELFSSFHSNIFLDGPPLRTNKLNNEKLK